MVHNYIRYGQILPSMRIPMAVQGFAIPAGGVIIIVSILISTWDGVKMAVSGKESA